MHETAAALATARWPLTAGRQADWLRDLASDDGLTGFMPPALPDAVWVLHSMYEYERRVLRGGGPEIVPGLDPADVMDAVSGEHPGPHWRRLRWTELARRIGDPTVPEGRLPCHSAFPSIAPRPWPVGIQAPPEGSLDRAAWNRLITILTKHSPQGPETPCLAYYSPMLHGAEDFENPHIRTGTLADAHVLYDHPEEHSWSPSNLWPQDQSWVLCTDYDLWATKVAGPIELIEALLDDGDLEAIRLPWAT